MSYSVAVVTALVAVWAVLVGVILNSDDSPESAVLRVVKHHTSCSLADIYLETKVYGITYSELRSLVKCLEDKGKVLRTRDGSIRYALVESPKRSPVSMLA
jgi:hypothetical protein